MKALAAGILGLLFLPHTLRAAQPGAPDPRLHVFHYENVLGTSLAFKIAARSADDSIRARTAALAEIDRLARVFSAYDPASEFSAWLKTSRRPASVSPELFQVLELFDQWRVRTDGALDPAAEVACRLWRNAAARQQLPSPAELDAAIAAIRQPHWRLDPAAGTATHLTDEPLILNSFVKSFIASRACDVLLGSGNIDAAVVNLGGDLMVRGDWTEVVEIADPRADAENSDPIARLQVRNRAVATSGGYRRGEQIGGRWYSHIVDPRTARPVDHVLSATVVAANATDAGALATALCVLPPAEGLRLAASVRGVECLIVTRDGQSVASPGWKQLEAPRVQLDEAAGGLPATATTKTVADNLWDTGLELRINLELAHIDGQRAERPFVAVWIEGQDKMPVRMLALWFNTPRYLPDLKSWYRGERLRALGDGTDLARAVSSATRNPGKYSLTWDGNDDHGKRVKAGKYTVFIEAVREHGTYQLIRQEMEFTGAPRQVELKGNVEVASASLDYHKKTGTH